MAASPAPLLLRELLQVQELRARAYARLHAGFRELTGGTAAPSPKAAPAAAEPAYASLLSELTSEFSALSARARAVEAALLQNDADAGARDAASLVRRVQEGERDKLRLELALQRLRRPFAARAFSWQRAAAAAAGAGAGEVGGEGEDAPREDDAGVGGPLDPAELARLRARGCGCGGGGGGGGGGDHRDHDPSGGGGGERDQQAPPEPTEAEWRAAVDEAVRELDAAIGRINEAVEEAMMALDEGDA